MYRQRARLSAKEADDTAVEHFRLCFVSFACQAGKLALQVHPVSALAAVDGSETLA